MEAEHTAGSLTATVPLPPDVVIRDARPDELDAVADVIAQAYAEYGPAEGSSPETEEAFREYRKDIVDVRGRAERGAVAIVAERRRPCDRFRHLLPTGYRQVGLGMAG